MCGFPKNIFAEMLQKFMRYCQKACQYSQIKKGISHLVPSVTYELFQYQFFDFDCFRSLLTFPSYCMHT